MADDKGSFVVYTDIKEIIDQLDDTQVATLFRTMVNYRMTGKAPKLSGTLKYIFIPIRQQMDRDKEKWDKTRAERAKAGQKGGQKSAELRAKQKQANEANASIENDTDKFTDNIIVEAKASKASRVEANEANQAVTVTVTDNVTVTDTVTDNVTTTVTVPSGSGSDDDDFFNIWKKMSPSDVDKVYDVYPESGGNLIQTVYEDVRDKKKVVEHPVQYILGYAKNVGWDDKQNGGVAL